MVNQDTTISTSYQVNQNPLPTDVALADQTVSTQSRVSHVISSALKVRNLETIKGYKKRLVEQYLAS